MISKAFADFTYAIELTTFADACMKGANKPDFGSITKCTYDLRRLHGPFLEGVFTLIGSQIQQTRLS